MTITALQSDTVGHTVFKDIWQDNNSALATGDNTGFYRVHVKFKTLMCSCVSAKKAPSNHSFVFLFSQVTQLVQLC